VRESIVYWNALDGKLFAGHYEILRTRRVDDMGQVFCRFRQWKVVRSYPYFLFATSKTELIWVSMSAYWSFLSKRRSWKRIQILWEKSRLCDKLSDWWIYIGNMKSISTTDNIVLAQTCPVENSTQSLRKVEI